MTDHQKEVIKFLTKPIWYPVCEVAKAIREIFTLWLKSLTGDCPIDAWGCFWVTLLILFIIAMFTAMFTMTLFWKTFLGIAITMYLGFYYFREYKKRK